MDMYQKRKIRAENKKIIVKKVFQKSTFRGWDGFMENFLKALKIQTFLL